MYNRNVCYSETTPVMNINTCQLTSTLHMLPNDVVNVNKMFIYDTGKYVCGGVTSFCASCMTNLSDNNGEHLEIGRWLATL